MRELPWRNTHDPYIVWVSEIILQQTRINQGIGYFRRFVDRFPDVQSLASAPEDEVLKIWQGLGYYSRARNMHSASQTIVEKHNGKFPNNYHSILSLKGIGEYTAAAVASIAFGLPYAVVDGNVFRVLSRFFEIGDPIDSSSGKRKFMEIAQSIIDIENPGNHNQAMMELGALICTPKQPKCFDCPLQTMCKAYSGSSVTKYPVKNGRVAPTNRYFNYFHVVYNGNTYICKRNEADVWRNLYELPLIETERQLDFVELALHQEFKNMFPINEKNIFTHKLRLRHVLTHRIINADFYLVELADEYKFNSTGKFLKIREETLPDYPVSKMLHKYFDTI